jgi:hypothetical protein
MRTALTSLALATTLTCILGPIANAFADDADILIMTQNVYEGTDFTEITSATTLPAFLGAVTLTRQNILATKPDVRAAAVAREIVREQPDLVATGSIRWAHVVRSESVGNDCHRNDIHHQDSERRETR